MKNTKKLLSILLAVLMIASSAVFFAAAEPVALSEANITVYPTANGSIFFGQKVSDGITLSGGEVQYEGAVVPGHFELANPDEVANVVYSKYRADIAFVPDDSQSFTGFECIKSRNVRFPVLKATPFVDFENDPPVAKKASTTGVKLSECEITGGKAINPYNGVDITNWQWTAPDTIINNSGYHEAFLKAGSTYEEVKTMIFVGFEQDKTELTVSVLPTISNIVFDPGLKWEDIKIEGGEIVEQDTGITVPGSFSFAPSTLSMYINTSVDKADVVFTPDDTEKYFPLYLTVPMTVEKADMKFTDEDGNEIVPVITIPYGTRLTDDVLRMLKPYIHITATTYVFSVSEFHYKEIQPLGDNELKVKVACTNVNYKPTVLPFILKVVPGVIGVDIMRTAGETVNEILLYMSTQEYYQTVKGTFAFYANGKLIKDGVKLWERVAWTPEKSGEYEIRSVYTPTENDPAIVEDTVEKWNVILKWKLTAVNCEIKTSKPAYGPIPCGTGIQAFVNEPEKFRSWKITDQNGKEYLPDGLTKDDLKNPEINFIMPDFPITVEAKMRGGGIDIGDIDFSDLDFGKLLEGDSPCKLINLLKNLRTMITDMIAKILAPVEKIKELS